jgi:nitroimidazol reductase NimA-like FMN-containing flavoprotein (pyridoxamine 5'-phosphate oxidase superfamily)
VTQNSEAARPTSGATRVRRHPERARYDRETVDQVLDEGLICHLGFVAGGRPYVIPTIHARVGDVVYVHGSPVSRMLNTLKAGVDVCLTVTILDGLVLARSAFSSSLNYRSAVVLGRAVEVTDLAEKQAAFEAVVEHVAQGRWDDCRWPTPKETAATTIVRLPIREFSAKVRTGPPKDPVEDLGLPYWAGVVPFVLATGAPVDSPDLKPGRAQPPYTLRYTR